jgi:hypothetical protein
MNTFEHKRDDESNSGRVIAVRKPAFSDPFAELCALLSVLGVLVALALFANALGLRPAAGKSALTKERLPAAPPATGCSGPQNAAK